MVNLINVFKNLKSDTIQIGPKKALTGLGYRAANKIVNIQRFEIIVLRRENLVPLDHAMYSNISSRLATKDDLEQMISEGKWKITNELRESFRNGDSCLLSYVDGNMAGYTWVHTAGHPRLIPGLRISVPKNYVYNFAGFTLQEFRGKGLQPYRHHEILNSSEWNEKLGMIGYVDSTNWSSKNGQAKSGYQRIGDLTIMGTGDNMKVIFSKELKKMGIERLKDLSV